MTEWFQIGEEDLDGTFGDAALIGIPYEQFTERFGIAFTENPRYGAGPAASAVVELRSGQQFILQHEYDHPQPGVWRFCRIGWDSESQLAAFADGFGLAPDDYRWIKRGDGWFDASTGERI